MKQIQNFYNKIKNSLIFAWLLTFSVFYFCLSFAQWNLNPKYWNPDFRNTCFCVLLVVELIIGMFYFFNQISYNREYD